MTVLTFPANPAAQNPPNFFSPTSTPDSTANGVTYVWDGEKWIGTGTPYGPDPKKITYTYPGGVEQTIQARLEQYVSV